MAGEWPHLPAYQSEADALCATPSDWTAQQIESLFEKLPIGKRFDQKTSSSTGRVPVVDQSAEGYVGFHNEAAGVEASHAAPVVTFANHTCEMRVMRRPFSVIQNVFPMIGKQGVCDTLFFYYATNGRVHIEEYKGHYPDYRRLWLPLPPLPEQKRIAHILGTLDDKIELNRRMNATLEGISRAIFKSWFVDCDPVRQKAAGKQPVGMDAQTAALFPDSFEDSEIGEVPKGWEVGRLSDVAEHPRRAARPGEIPVGTPYIGLEHMPRRCIALSEWGEGDAVESNKFEFQRDEILFGKLRPYFHKVGVAPVDGVCSTDIVVARARSPEWFGFALGVMSSDEFVAYTNAGSTGTKMPRTNWDDMSRYEAVLPPESVAEAFTSVVQPAVASIAARIHQSRTLAALRDTLLPKLLSGEIRFPEAEEAVEEVLG